MSDQTFDPIDPVVGDFQVVESTPPSGERLAGTIRFEAHGTFAHGTAMRQDGIEQHSLAAMFRGRLLIATGPKDKVEIGAYHLSGDHLQGIWVPPGAKGCDLAMCGREESRRNGEGSFIILKAHAVDQMPYTGRLAINYVDPPELKVRRVEFRWSLHDGEYASFGLASGEILVSTFNFEPNTPFSIGIYEPHKGEWHGAVAHSDAGATAHEVLRRRP